LGRTAGHEVRESGYMPLSAATMRVGMSWHGDGQLSEGVLIVMGERRI
jgi:hypothetical protein